ncbi:MAG: replication-associated recombination protein A [Lachnospiraceae bacterium]|nr:replication-associated recombination protein A [Lachnospiraceae bacterium]
MNLIDMLGDAQKKKQAPLASRMRARTLDEIVGQSHIIGEGRQLRRAISADQLGSIILYGPPGTGKTTLAKVIANTTKGEFCQLNATVAGKKDMEEIVAQARQSLAAGRKTILFIDEIHRFNKSQQDYLLPFVEDGTLTLIGATTENPFFEVNQALLSRSHLYQLEPLSVEDIVSLLQRALTDTDRGLAAFHADIDEETLCLIAHMAGGDARAALNGLELAVLTTPAGINGRVHIDAEVIAECMQKKILAYDKNQDNHYDTISAFIKSMRGSAPDATVFYLAKMLAGGEDIKFIARRIMICAAEDVGLADPMALVVATNASLAVERIGMPEARIILSEAALYVANAPKSNAAYLAIDAALAVARTTTTSVPPHLRDAHYKGAAALGHGLNYQYAHDFPEHYVQQQYLPDEIREQRFYEPGELGAEASMKERLERLRNRS